MFASSSSLRTFYLRSWYRIIPCHRHLCTTGSNTTSMIRSSSSFSSFAKTFPMIRFSNKRNCCYPYDQYNLRSFISNCKEQIVVTKHQQRPLSVVATIIKNNFNGLLSTPITVYNTKRCYSITTILLQSQSSSQSSSTTTKTTKPMIGILGTIFFGSLCIGTFILGVWQTQRFYTKQVLIQQRTKDLFDTQPYTSYNEYKNDIEKTSQQQSKQDQYQSLRPITLHGKYHHEYEILVGPRSAPNITNTSIISSNTNDADTLSSLVSGKGYYIITPLEIINDSTNTSSNNHRKKEYVLINRGWVPQNMVIPKNNRGNNHQNNQNNNNNILNWDRPKDIVQITVVPSKGEEPRFFIPQHNFNTQPAILYWYDINTMYEIAYPNYENDENEDTISSSSTPSPSVQEHIQNLILPYATKIMTNKEQEELYETMKQNNNKNIWPIAPSIQHIGDFKVSPSIHLGYAVTWYGLSMAGLYMTRLLLLKR